MRIEEQLFLRHVRQELKLAGYELFISKGKYVRDKDVGPSSGIFDEGGKRLSIAVGAGNWILTLAHEYSHFKQLQKNTRAHRVHDKCKANIWNWLAGKVEYTPDVLNRCVLTTIMMERECELFAIKELKKHNIRFDVLKYHRQANAYLYFYTFVQKHRKWLSPRKYSVSELIEIQQLMPSKIKRSFKRMPKGYEELVLTYCI